MIRSRLITDVQIAVIQRELKHMKQNMISTPDTEASYDKIQDTLDRLMPA